MRTITGRLSVWLAGTVLGAGTVIAAPTMSAYACGAETGPAAVARDNAEPSAVRVSGPGSLTLHVGSPEQYAITVSNSGPGFTGSIGFEVSAGDAGMPNITMEQLTSSGHWKALPEEGAMLRRYFTADGLTFQTGETSFGFRVTVDAARESMTFGAIVWDAAGTRVGSTGFRATAKDGVKPQVRTTFPDRLRRGGPYREFDVTVRNPSATTFHKVRVNLDLAALAAAPHSGRGYLAARDVRLEKRVGGAWQPVALRDGDCDPGVGATVSGPSDLAPGATRNLHLRIRLTDSTPNVLRSGDYFVNVITPDLEEGPSISGHFAIEPRRHSGGSGQLTSPPSATPTTPAGPGSQPAETPSKLAHTGAVLLPVAGGLLLMLGGIGVVALVRHRRRTG